MSLEPGSLLEAWFQRIYDERMRDLPVHNHAVSIELYGLRPHGEGWMGVMIAPWFMNLLALPADPAVWDHLRDGQMSTWEMATGPRRFWADRADGVGVFQMSSLHSPPPYKSQDEARAAAERALEDALRPVEPPPAEEPAKAEETRRTVDRRGLLRGLTGG